jgi:hypothetical protein
LLHRLPSANHRSHSDQGWRTALWCTRIYNRILRPGLSVILPEQDVPDTPIRRRFDQLDAAIGEWLEQQKVPV